jgi:hypothetical protein
MGFSPLPSSSHPLWKTLWKNVNPHPRDRRTKNETHGRRKLRSAVNYPRALVPALKLGDPARTDVIKAALGAGESKPIGPAKLMSESAGHRRREIDSLAILPTSLGSLVCRSILRRTAFAALC